MYLRRQRGMDVGNQKGWVGFGFETIDNLCELGLESVIMIEPSEPHRLDESSDDVRVEIDEISRRIAVSKRAEHVSATAERNGCGQNQKGWGWVWGLGLKL